MTPPPVAPPILPAITGLDLLALLLLLHVWLVGVGLAIYADGSSLPWSDRIDLGARSYAVLTLLATVVVWLPFALESYPAVLGERTIRRPLVPFAIGLTLVWAGFYYLGGALTTLRSSLSVRRTAAVDAGDVDSGPIRLTGTVQPVEEPLETPVSGSAAVCYELAVTRGIVPDADGEDSSKPAESEPEHAAPSGGVLDSLFEETIPVSDKRSRFVLADETGRVVVDPSATRLHLAGAERETTVVPAGERPSGPLSRHLHTETEYEPTDRREVYREVAVEPGDELTVIGVARRDGRDGPSSSTANQQSEESAGSDADGDPSPDGDSDADGDSNPNPDTALLEATDGVSASIVAAGPDRRVDRYFRRTLVGCALAAIALIGTGLVVLSALVGLG